MCDRPPCPFTLQATSTRSCSSAATAVATWRCRLVTCRLQCLEVSDMCSGKRVHVVAAFIAVVTICSPLARCTAGAPDAVDFDPEPAQPADGATSVVWGQRECVLQATVLICGSLAASCVRHSTFTCDISSRQVYYLFSNNHINEIVSMRFDFDDDEVLVRRLGGRCQPPLEVVTCRWHVVCAASLSCACPANHDLRCRDTSSIC